MVYLLNTLDHTITFHDANRAVVEQYATDHPSVGEAIVEVVNPAYAMMALRDATQRTWQDGVKPLLQKLAEYPNLSLVSDELTLELFMTFLGVNDELAQEQMRAYVRELRPSQGKHIEKVSIDLETGREIPASEAK